MRIAQVIRSGETYGNSKLKAELFFFCIIIRSQAASNNFRG